MEVSSETTCPSCHLIVSAASCFCPNCGKPLRDKPYAVSLSRQIVIYSVSLFLPPFGFWYAWKYLKQPDDKSKKIGIAAVILTVISIIVTVWLAKGFINLINQALNPINNFNF